MCKRRYGQLASLDRARSAGKIRAYIGSWANGGTADTAMIARVHFGDTDRNLSRNPQVMQLVADAERPNDSARRAGLYRQALQIIADQAYWIPLYTRPEERRVGKECVSTCRSRWSRDPS